MRTLILAVLCSLLALPLGAIANDDDDRGGGTVTTHGGTGGAASAGATASGTVTGGSTVQSVTTRSYAGGGTGLTSTAPCLGSSGFLFNLFSTTYVEKGCVVRHYAATTCKDDSCRMRLACLDPDLIIEAKTALGCTP